MSKPELKAEAISLRVNEHLSLREIRQRTGASTGSLSNWLRDYPLTREEQRAKQADKLRGRRSPLRLVRGEPSKYVSMTAENLTTLEKAKIAETAVLFRCVLRRFNVYGSPFDGDKADWVVEVPQGRMLKLQVRCCYAAKRGGSPQISVRRTLRGGRHERFKVGDFDFLVGYDLHTDTAYVYTWNEITQYKDSICVGTDHAEAFDKMLS